MNLLASVVAGLIALALPVCGLAQQTQPSRSRIEAQKKDVVESWSLGDQAWDFKDILAAYEPTKGYLESRQSRGQLVVWKLRLVKDFEDGAARLHEEMRGSPFKIVLLDEDRTTINPDLPAQITPVPGKMNDAIEMYIVLPDAEILRDVKLIRVQRRTDVGF